MALKRSELNCCAGWVCNQALASFYLGNSLLSGWFWTGWVGIKNEAVIKVKTANVDFLILQISQLRQKRS